MKKLLMFFTVVVVVICLLQSNTVFAKDDVKMYNFFQLKYKVNDSFDAFIQPDTRFNDDIGKFNYYHVRTGVVFHAYKNLDLGSTYRFVESKKAKGNWLNERRLEFDIAPKIVINGFKLVNRSRFEHRRLEVSKDRWRYRNLSKVAYPMEIKGFDCVPYVGEEVFYDFETDKWFLNWATIGVDKKITKNLTLGIFYLNEVARVGLRNEWDTNHFVGTKVAFSF